MIQFSTPKHHWNYFLALERDLHDISQYVEFCQDNLPTYSIEFAHILLSAASEVDVVMKLLCKMIDSDGSHRKINHYREVILNNISSFIDEAVTIPRYAMSHKPWENWDSIDSPEWWRGYNKVKHQRSSYYNQANLQNAVNAVGALLITTIYYYKFAYSKENNDIEISFREVTRQLGYSSNGFLFLNPEYYYQTLLT